MLPRVLLLLALLASSAAAGERYQVFAGGLEAGFEYVTLREKAGRTLLDSRAVLRREEREHELTLHLELDAKTGELIRFEATGRAGGTRKTGMFAVVDGEIVGEIRSGEKSEPYRLPLARGTLVLVEPFAAPWLLIAARYDRDRGEPKTFPVVFPLEGRVGEVTVSRREDQAIEIDRQVHLATRLLARPDRGESANLWLDAEGQILVCARSVAGISAVRGSRAILGLKSGSDPKDPPEAHSTRIRFASTGITLAGTFTRPRAGDGPYPAVLLLSGSGPQDRNGNAPGTELQWNYLHSIAMALAKSGVASLRFDERGVGKSGGTFFDAGLSDLVADTASALGYLASREDVDPKRVILLGHSEGALHAALLAGAKDTPVRALILLGAPAEPVDRVLLRQVAGQLNRRKVPREEALRVLGDLRAFYEHVRLSDTPVVTRNDRPRNVLWLREHMELSLRQVYGEVRCPVLLLHGERDLQVPASHAARIARIMNRPDVTVALLDGLDHFLIEGRGTIQDYGDARRHVAGPALTRITEWVEGVLK